MRCVLLYHSVVHHLDMMVEVLQIVLEGTDGLNRKQAARNEGDTLIACTVALIHF